MSGFLIPQYLKFIDGGTLTTIGNDGGTSVTTGPDGSVYVTGYANSGTDTFGTIYFAGQFYNKPVTRADAMYVGKLDTNGAPVWLRMLDGLTDDDSDTGDRGRSISADSDGNIYVTGYANSPDITITAFRFITCNVGSSSSVVYNKPADSLKSIVLLKIDTSGALQWLRTLHGSGNEEGVSIRVNGTNAYFTGYTNSQTTPLQYNNCLQGSSTTQIWNKPLTTSESVIIGKIDGSNGDLMWLKLLDGNGSARGNGIAVENSGDVLITGYTITGGTSINFINCSIGISTTIGLTKESTIGNVLFVLRLNSLGDFQWMKILDSSASNIGYAITVGYESFIKVYVTGSPNNTTDGSMVYSSVVASTLPLPPPTPLTPQTWNVPPFQASTLTAKIDFITGNLEWLSFLGGSTTTNISTGIAISPIFTQDIYVSGYYPLTGPVFFQKAVVSPGILPLPLSITAPASSGQADGGFILKLDISGNYSAFKRIYVNLGATNHYRIKGITVDNFNDVYIIGDTSQTTGSQVVNFADEDFSKPTTIFDSAFIGKLKNPSPPDNTICYAKGTLIGTSRGMIPIEDIALSDKIRTYGCIEEKMFKPVHGVPFKTRTRVQDTRIKNRFANIKFIGNFSINGMRGDTAPICITAGALGENRPERDLFVSPNHSILIGNRLIFAKDLVNEISIYQDMSFETIEYYHILSDDHYLINANGALSETLASEEISIFESLHSFPTPIQKSVEYNFKHGLNIDKNEDKDLLCSEINYSVTELVYSKI